MTQIFKTSIPNNLLFDLLDLICIKNDKFYTLNLDAYKKGIYNNNIQQFIETCKSYYHISKQKYLERKITYNSFTTILRQICNNNNINYTYKIKYNKSTYSIYYYICRIL
jgi:hypothetical protein